ncbi:MAG: SRPBCC domain-containing protein [Sphingobium sp.]|nr:SRPBCC domain-containing protein [Sphingobium sp.]
MSELPTFVLEKTFEAPRSLVWRTWTDPKLLSRWYGPNVETIIHQLDARPGGLWLNEMKMSRGSSYQRSEYLEVVEPERLVCLMANADQNWNVTANPMMPDWPRILLTTVTFKEEAGRTLMTLSWTPHEASDAEISCFANAMGNLGKGWAAGFDVLEKMLAELQV